MQEQNEESISREQTPPSLASKGKKPLKETAPHKATASTSAKQEADPPQNEKSSSIPLKLPDPPKQQFKEAITEKGPTPFNLQKELEKVKIPVPLIELLKKPSYKAQVSQFMQPHGVSPLPDSLNLQEERPMVVFGPHVEEQDSTTPPFYVNLVLRDLLFHNCMLDSEASHNMFPLFIMEQFWL